MFAALAMCALLVSNVASATRSISKDRFLQANTPEPLTSLKKVKSPKGAKNPNVAKNPKLPKSAKGAKSAKEAKSIKLKKGCGGKGGGKGGGEGGGEGMDSCAPSHPPSHSPSTSQSPSKSMEPSASPIANLDPPDPDQPTSSPTPSPNASPPTPVLDTPLPTTSPTPSPTAPLPTPVLDTPSPTTSPTPSPTTPPPTLVLDTPLPTTSTTIAAKFDTEDFEGGQISRCTNTSVDNESTNGNDETTWEVSFNYAVFATEGSNIDTLIDAVENATHLVLVQKFMKCDAAIPQERRLQSSELDLIVVSSNPRDQVVSQNDMCDNLPPKEGSTCHPIEGGFRFSSTESDLSINSTIDAFDAFFEAEMGEGGSIAVADSNITGMKFLGVTNINPAKIGDPVNGIEDPIGPQNNNGNKNTILPATLGTIAAVGFVLVGLLMYRRRDTAQRDYSKYGDDDESMEQATIRASPSSSPSHSQGNQQVKIITEYPGDEDSLDNEHLQFCTDCPEGRNHCGLDTCVTCCERRVAPTSASIAAARESVRNMAPDYTMPNMSRNRSDVSKLSADLQTSDVCCCCDTVDV